MPVTVSQAAPVAMPEQVKTVIRQNYYAVPGTSKYGALPIGGQTVRFVGGSSSVFDASVPNPMTSDGDEYAEAAYNYLAPYVPGDSRQAWASTYKTFQNARTANVNVAGAWAAFIGAHEGFVRQASLAHVLIPATTGSGPAATPQGNPPTGGAVAPAGGGGTPAPYVDPRTPVPGNDAIDQKTLIIGGAVLAGSIVLGIVVHRLAFGGGK